MYIKSPTNKVNFSCEDKGFLIYIINNPNDFDNNMH